MHEVMKAVEQKDAVLYERLTTISSNLQSIRDDIQQCPDENTEKLIQNPDMFTTEWQELTDAEISNEDWLQETTTTTTTLLVTASEYYTDDTDLMTDIGSGMADLTAAAIETMSNELDLPEVDLLLSNMPTPSPLVGFNIQADDNVQGLSIIIVLLAALIGVIMWTIGKHSPRA